MTKVSSKATSVTFKRGTFPLFPKSTMAQQMLKAIEHSHNGVSQIDRILKHGDAYVVMFQNQYYSSFSQGLVTNFRVAIFQDDGHGQFIKMNDVIAETQEERKVK